MNKGSAIVGFILCFFAGIAAMWGVDRSWKGSEGHATASKEAGAVGVPDHVNPGAVKVELYVMSQCPYGVQAENGFKDAVEKLGADVDFKVEFIGQKEGGNLTSMHGPNEVKGDTVQACAQKYTAKWFQLILCQNKNSREVATNWEACASEVGAPVDKIRACADGEEGKTLLAASFDRADKKGAHGSPTIYVAGNQYQGGRRPADFMKAICNAYQGSKPAACNDIPESPKVNVTIIGDKRCGDDCDPRGLQGMISRVVANPVVKTLDYGDAEGKKLFDSIKGDKGMNLPAALFDSTLDADKEASQQISRMLQERGSYKVFARGEWNPACHDDGGCKLDECKDTVACRPEEPGKLEVFVMSQCPFGVKGLNAMQEVLQNFQKNKAKVDFQIHFIGNGNAKDGLQSMHGQGEVDEDIREACAIEHFGKDAKYMDYIWCRNKNIRDTAWESCATKENGIDAAAIKKCFEGEQGKALLEKSFDFSSKAGMGASPTWLANGKYKFSGIDPETIKSEFCKHNKLPGCEATLSGPPPQQQGAAAPGCGG